METRVYKAFDQIRADEKVVAHTKQFIAAKSMEKQQGFRSVRKVLAACATLFILMGTSGLYFANVSPVSYISIDVNPSIELELNCFDKIIGAYAYNDNGREILDMVSVKGMKAEEAVDTIVTSEAMQPYLADNADLTFTIASDNADKEQNLYNLLENCNSSHEYNATSRLANTNSISEAHDCGLSFGKYAAYLQLYEYDNTVTVEDCHNMSMGELHSMIKEHETDGQHESSGHGHGGNSHHNNK